MRIRRLAHAGLLIETAHTRCLMDPLLFEPFEAGINRFEPPLRIDVAAVAARAGFVMLSHEHMDHFCVRSLDRVARDRLVVYPAGATLIEHALLALGFRDLRPVVPGQTLQIADLQLTFTPSNVSFPEIGVLAGAAGLWFWNCVDTDATEAAFGLVAARTSRLDLMFANFQVLAEEELGCDGLGSAFPAERYAQRLRAVVEANPRVAVPASCGYSYATQPWLNQRGFPVCEEDFIHDIATIAPATSGVRVAPGAVIDVASGAVHDDELGLVERGLSTLSLDWRPDHGVPPLRDDDPCGHGTPALRTQVAAVLHERFPRGLHEPSLRRWRERLAAASLVWQLVVVYPDGSRDERWLDFAAPTAWLTAPPRPVRLVTSICASTVVGLCNGEATPYRALFTRRVVLRLYQATRWGLQRTGTLADEPMARVLFPGANRRFVDAQLRRLGYAPEAPASAHGWRGIRTLPRR